MKFVYFKSRCIGAGHDFWRSLLILASLNPFCFAESVRPIVYKQLDENIVYGIRIACHTGTTTLLFPAPISGIYGQRVSKTPQDNADFLINFVPGSSHFTLRALHDKANDQLTVIFEKKAYVLHLTAAENAHFTVSFFYPSRITSGKLLVTSDRLLSILDRAKAYGVLTNGTSDILVGVEHTILNREISYEGFRVVLREVYRFDPEDVLVFHIEFRNESDHLIHYQPHQLAARLGDRIYKQAITDASGIIPRDGKTNAFFAITGMPGGGRNNLRAENPWNILVVRAERR
ncbi:MAG: hypothetical protein C5B47_07095 [Verrucomicrobia bacterium]|nr:MAG: hypothetical protein C5B47_07095 [Verrucomicrobiota bacterium]